MPGIVKKSKTINLFGASVLGALLSVVRLSSGLIKTKVIAVLLGAAGIGLLSQATEAWLLAIAIGSMMLGGGLTTQLRKTKDLEKQKALIRGTLSLQFLVVGSICILSAFFAPDLAVALFNDVAKTHWIYLMLFSIPLNVFAVGALEAVALANSKYKQYIWLSSFSTILSTAVICFGVLFYGVEAVFAGWLINSGLMFLGYLWILREDYLLRDLIKFNLKIDEARPLIIHGVSILASSVVQGLCLIAIRGNVLKHLGEANLGLIQISFAVTAYCTPFLTNQLWGHFHPIVSSIGENEKSYTELLKTLRWTIVLYFCFALGIHGYGEWFIRLAYTEEFLPAYSYFIEYFIGNSFYFIAFVFGVYFIAQARPHYYFIGVTTYFLIWLVTVDSQISVLGLHAVPRGHVYGAAVVAAAGLVWFTAKIGLVKSLSIWGLLLGSLALLVGQYYFVEIQNISWPGYLVPLAYMGIVLPIITKKL